VNRLHEGGGKGHCQNQVLPGAHGLLPHLLHLGVVLIPQREQRCSVKRAFEEGGREGPPYTKFFSGVPELACDDLPGLQRPCIKSVNSAGDTNRGH
jgi:hypothetical protein